VVTGPVATVRPAGDGDRAALAGLAGGADRAGLRLSAARQGTETMLVAAEGPVVVGAVSVRWHGGCDPPHPWRYGVQVAPSHRRRGIGRTLVAAAETAAAERGAAYLSLDADRADARAVDFYRSLGYAVVRAHDHRWRDAGPRTGAVRVTGVAATWIMRRRLG
jgi:ribosomal protein S18 acetylase RimI-like enzyme